MTKETIIHLITELSNYLLEAKPTRMVLSLDHETDLLHLTIKDDISRRDEELESMRRALGAQGRPELAEYYSGMAGCDFMGAPRLNLVGWRVKKAEINRTAEGTRIELWIGED